MAWSKLDIINLALTKLNKSSIQQIQDSDVFSDSAGRAFDLLYPSNIASKSWRFASKIQLLNVLVDPPLISRWRYQLQLPSDYLAAIRTYPRMDYQIFGNVIYANNNIVDLEYRYLPDPTNLPAYFVHYFALIIAAWYADSVAEHDQLSAKLANEAQIQLGEALFTDSQSHPISPILSNPMVNARYGGCDYGYGYDYPPYTT